MRMTHAKLGLAAVAAALLATAATAKSDPPAFVPDAPGQKVAGWTKAPEAKPDTIRFAVIGESLTGNRFRRVFLCVPPPPDDDVSPRAQAARAWLDRVELTMSVGAQPTNLWRSW